MILQFAGYTFGAIRQEFHSELKLFAEFALLKARRKTTLFLPLWAALPWPLSLAERREGRRTGGGPKSDALSRSRAAPRRVRSLWDPVPLSRSDNSARRKF